MKILTVVGARPQFIKAAAMSAEIMNHPDLHEVIVNTGQHYDKGMSDVFFSELGIPDPKYNLNIHSLSHGSMTGRMLEGLEEVFLSEKPDWILLYGDTNSTLAGALAASKTQIPIAHIESGLRSHNMAMPEEINRIVTDRLSSLLLCPTPQSEENLLREGFPFPCSGYPLQRVVNVGDIMFDAVKKFSGGEADKITKEAISRVNGAYILATVHRPSNTDNQENLQQIFDALSEIANSVKVIVPVHPRTRKKLDDFGIVYDPKSVILIDPVSYVSLQVLISGSNFVITDSGGLQKEAYFHLKRCITLRDDTEWGETVTSGWNVLAGASRRNIIAAATMSSEPAEHVDFYGSGNAAKKIITELKYGE